MTKLSQFKQAAIHVEALRKLRAFRQSYGGPDSPPRRAVIEIDCDHRPEPVVLSASSRAALNKALDVEEQSLCAELRGLSVVIDLDGPL